MKNTTSKNEAPARLYMYHKRWRSDLGLERWMDYVLGCTAVALALQDFLPFYIIYIVYTPKFYRCVMKLLRSWKNKKKMDFSLDYRIYCYRVGNLFFFFFMVVIFNSKIKNIKLLKLSTRINVLVSLL
jgi:hypothetical protein